jgi:hypothetical protein
MILVMDENKIISSGLNHQVTITMTFVNLMTYLQTYVILQFKHFSLQSDDLGSMRRAKSYTYELMTSKIFDHDFGEPDDHFADIHNFAVYAYFRLNLMIRERKNSHFSMQNGLFKTSK